MKMKFELSNVEKAKVDAWLKETVYPEVIAWQKKNVKNPDFIYKMCWNDGYPYEGAIGGGVTYEFTPTSIGNIINVRYKTFEQEFKLDVTDYDSF